MNLPPLPPSLAKKPEYKRACEPCVLAGAQPAGGAVPTVFWTVNRKGNYVMRSRCANCREPLGAVGPNSPLAVLAGPKPKDDPLLFDKSEYMLEESKHASDK